VPSLRRTLRRRRRRDKRNKRGRGSGDREVVTRDEGWLVVLVVEVRVGIERCDGRDWGRGQRSECTVRQDDDVVQVGNEVVGEVQ
jgi:hypothetical protein